MDIKVATTQFRHKPGNKKYNLNIIKEMTIKAAKTGVKIICFPEMCITGYWHVRNLDCSEVFLLSEDPINGPSSKELQKLSRKYNIIIGAGIIEKASDGKLYNTYLVTQPDREVEFHRKLHCFISPYMSSGNNFTVIDTSLGVKLGVLICYDNNIVENTRLTALGGADILLAPHQTGGCANSTGRVLGKIDVELWENRIDKKEELVKEFQGIKGRKWLERWLPARAHDNGLFLMFSNGVGRDDDEVRTGNAMLIDCFGEIIEESKSIEDDIVIGTFSMELKNSALGRTWIQGCRPELYKELTTPKKTRNCMRYLKELESLNV